MQMPWIRQWSAERFTDINIGRYDNSYSAHRYIPSGDGMAQRRGYHPGPRNGE